MQIAGYKFHLLNAPALCSTPGVLIYIHQATGKHFVRVMRNVRKQRGKNNYPTPLKELLKTNTSEVLVYVADVVNDTKEALHGASKVIRTHLTAKGVLYKKPETETVVERFTVWRMRHRQSGAVFYFEEVKGVEVQRKIVHRLKTFNNYVVRSTINANRVMYCFASKFFPLKASDWDVEDLNLDFPLQREAILRIGTLSKLHLEANEVVLNRIFSFDSLYYRNTFLKLPRIGIEEYLG